MLAETRRIKLSIGMPAQTLRDLKREHLHLLRQEFARVVFSCRFCEDGSGCVDLWLSASKSVPVLSRMTQLVRDLKPEMLTIPVQNPAIMGLFRGKSGANSMALERHRHMAVACPFGYHRGTPPRPGFALRLTTQREILWKKLSARSARVCSSKRRRTLRQRALLLASSGSLAQTLSRRPKVQVTRAAR